MTSALLFSTLLKRNSADRKGGCSWYDHDNLVPTFHALDWFDSLTTLSWPTSLIFPEFSNCFFYIYPTRTFHHYLFLLVYVRLSGCLSSFCTNFTFLCVCFLVYILSTSYSTPHQWQLSKFRSAWNSNLLIMTLQIIFFPDVFLLHLFLLPSFISKRLAILATPGTCINPWTDVREHSTIVLESFQVDLGLEALSILSM